MVVMGLATVRRWAPLALACLSLPVMFFSAFLVQSQEGRCGVVFCVMAVLWITEAVPLAVTALIPVFGLPLLGVLETDAVCRVYLKSTNFMFMGGLMMAVAIEHVNLHKRIALLVILKTGHSPRLLMAGFMITTTFLSMWISNTAAAAIIVPIVDAIVLKLAQIKLQHSTMQMKTRNEEEEEEEEEGEEDRGSEVSGVGGEGDGVEGGSWSSSSRKGIQSPGLIHDYHKQSTLTHYVNYCDLSDEDPHKMGRKDYEVLKLRNTGQNGRCLTNKKDHTRREEEENEVINMKKKDEGLDNEEEGDNKRVKQEANDEWDGKIMRDVHDANALEKRRKGQNSDDNNDDDDAEEVPEIRALRQMFMLSVAFAANIGGTGSPLGCAPNIILMGLLQNTFNEPTGLNFATWLAYNFPGLVICGLMGWLWLQLLYRKSAGVSLQATRASDNEVRSFLETQYRGLGVLSRKEAVVLVSFSVLVLLWVFRAPGFVPGWSKIFTDAYGVKIAAATPVMLTVFVLFLIPSGADQHDSRGGKVPEVCLTWEVLERRLPWRMILLLGGGLAIAEGAKTSGLSEYIGGQLQALNFLPREVVVLVVTCTTALLTELASNTATASVILPILLDMSLAMKIHPFHLLVPATTCCAYAFMLPVATPGNTIILSAARMTTYEMMKAGAMMNLLCVLVVNITINTLGVIMFDLNTFPAWANITTAIP